MPYQLKILPSAERDLAKLERDIAERIVQVIDSLPDIPRPPGAGPLQGYRGLLRLREGDYRIIYRVDDATGEVEILLVGHRREVYRKLPGRIRNLP